MIYFKHPGTGEVFAYETKSQRDTFGDSALVAMSKAEVEAHLNPVPAPLSREQINTLRLVAFADPVTGSDRYFVEALSAKDPESAEKATAAGNARRAEIQAQYPWPDEGK